MITVAQLLPHFNEKKSQLAKALNVSRQAVNKWPEGVLPELQEKKIRYEVLPHIYHPAIEAESGNVEQILIDQNNNKTT